MTPTPWIKSNWIRDIAIITATRAITGVGGAIGTEVFTEYWIATLGGGVSVTTTMEIDGRNKGWTSYGVADGLLSNDIWCVAADRMGRRWVGTDRGVGVMLPAGDGYEVLKYRGVRWVRDIVIDKSGRAWCATQGDGVYLLRLVDQQIVEEGHYTVFDGLASDMVWDVELEGGDVLTTEVKWFGTAHGASRFKGATALPTETHTPTPTPTRTGTPPTSTPTASATPSSILMLPLILRDA